MSAMSGYGFKAKRVAGVTTLLDKHLGGMIANAEPQTRVDMEEQAATGQYELAVLQPAAIFPRLRLEMKVQQLEHYIADYSATNKFCFVSAEGALATHNLYVTDGLDPFKWTGCLVDSCEVTIPIRGAVMATINVLAKTRTPQAYGSAPSAITDAVLMHTNVNTMTIGGTTAYDISGDFQEFRFGVNHNIQQEVLGTTLTPTEVLQRQTVYSGSIRRALKTQSWSAMAYNGTKQTIVLQINDNRTTPKKTKFTWTNAYITTQQKSVRGLDMIIERIDWRAKDLTLAAGA